ncbi:peptidase family M48 family protein [Striga asiatica]|uniref:Peptidase family M48 family protein n=1 Tax=Striga asiatica TaxID=4170 RepID=A0A5A7NXV2_STRAF|nr:peptidase family M48 family protein [Striga asiatica]
MGWYRRSSRFIYDAFHSCKPNTLIPRNPIQQSISRANLHSFASRPGSSSSKISEFSQSIFRNTFLQNGLKQNPFLGGAKRFYYVDRKQVYHFKPRGYKRWIENPRNVFAVILLGSGVVITVYFGNLETVPYTKRTHFVLLSSSLERDLGDNQFKQLKNQFKGKILPPLHPESIRIQSISQDIIEALQKGLSKEQVWSDIRYSPESVALSHEGYGHESVKALSDKMVDEEKWQGEDKWQKEDEVLDDQWVLQSRKKGHEKGMKSQTAHLEGLKWEVIVVDEPMVNAFCLPGGKIVVFTGLLKHFRADAEVATVIGHEVRVNFSFMYFCMGAAHTTHTLMIYKREMEVYGHVEYFICRLRMEMEADYIGLLLIASAGYDPRVAPQVYEKLGRVAGESALQDYLATHPSGKKRAQVLAQAKVMEEALSIYREVQAGRGVEENEMAVEMVLLLRKLPPTPDALTYGTVLPEYVVYLLARYVERQVTDAQYTVDLWREASVSLAEAECGH